MLKVALNIEAYSVKQHLLVEGSRPLLSNLVSRCKEKRNISTPGRSTPTCLEATCSSGVDKKDAYLTGE